MDNLFQKSSRILVVEDELIVAADIEGSLRDIGFEVVGTVGDAHQALAVVSREHPDLVLIDIQLHGDPAGLALAERIRSDWSIPVIFLTAYVKEEFMQRARAAGAYGYLSKPFRIEDLKVGILIALQQHRVAQELFAERNWLVTMLASLSDGVIATDPWGAIRYLNPAAEDLTRWSSAEALGRPIEDVYQLAHMDGAPISESRMRRALIEQKPIHKERFWMTMRSGGRIPVEDSVAPIFQDGRLLGAVAIFLDISNRLLAEGEQRKEQKRLRQEVQVTHAALGQTQEALRALSGRLITAQEDERRRVARELHDDFGQRAALMSWRVAELAKLAGFMPDNAFREIKLLEEDLDRLATGLRGVSHQLHPSVIADLGLATALGEISEQYREQGVDVTFVARNLPPAISNEVATGLYRIAQEALRNAVQHAPDAPILITLSGTGEILELKVEDPGPGFDIAKVRQVGGLGLLSMQERARVLGGSLAFTTAPEEGTVITACVPVKA
jgi:PAS domain S-box-containing protein